jgi:hypothetical protein
MVKCSKIRHCAKRQNVSGKHNTQQPDTMRLLNREEQDFCRRILEGDGDNNYLGNIIDKKLWGVRISITRNPQNVDLLFTIQNAQPTDEELEMTIQRSREISYLILNVVNLLKMLEKDNYIMLLQRATTIPNHSDFGQGVVNLPSISSNFSDPTISKLLIDFVDKEIFVTEEFRQFCQNKFIPRDERRFRKQSRNQWIAIGVALFAALTNFVFNTLAKLSDGTKIKQEQVNTIREDLKAINSNLDSIGTQTKIASEKIIDELKKKNEVQPKGKSAKK